MGAAALVLAALGADLEAARRTLGAVAGQLARASGAHRGAVPRGHPDGARFLAAATARAGRARGHDPDGPRTRPAPRAGGRPPARSLAAPALAPVAARLVQRRLRPAAAALGAARPLASQLIGPRPAGGAGP